MSVDVSGLTGLAGRAGGQARSAAHSTASATAVEFSRVGRRLAAHRGELLFLAGTLAFALIVGVLGYAALPTF